jgi:hypothetical protein
MEEVCSSETSGVLLPDYTPSCCMGIETYSLRNNGLSNSRAIGVRTSLEAMANSETDSIEIYMQTFHYTNGNPPSPLLPHGHRMPEPMRYNFRETVTQA